MNFETVRPMTRREWEPYRRMKQRFLTAVNQQTKGRMKAEQVAELCHELNRAYCRILGDNSQPEWKDAPDWQKQSAVKGVEFTLTHPSAPPSASHESWFAQKVADGWKYGPVKDPEKKEHPCMVPYDELPEEQRLKDHLFQGVVKACTPFLKP